VGIIGGGLSAADDTAKIRFAFRSRMLKIIKAVVVDLWKLVSKQAKGR
jgi:hypothetical protein